MILKNDMRNRVSKYIALHNGNEAELYYPNREDEETLVCVCEENGSFGAEFMYFTKQDLLDMLKLFEEQDQESK